MRTDSTSNTGSSAALAHITACEEAERGHSAVSMLTLQEGRAGRGLGEEGGGGGGGGVRKNVNLKHL